MLCTLYLQRRINTLASGSSDIRGKPKASTRFFKGKSWNTQLKTLHQDYCMA